MRDSQTLVFSSRFYLKIYISLMWVHYESNLRIVYSKNT